MNRGAYACGTQFATLVIDFDASTLGPQMQAWAADFVEGDITKEGFDELIAGLGPDVVPSNLGDYLNWRFKTHFMDGRAWTKEVNAGSHNHLMWSTVYYFNNQAYAYDAQMTMRFDIDTTVEREMKEWAEAHAGLAAPITRDQFAAAIAGIPDVAENLPANITF